MTSASFSMLSASSGLLSFTPRLLKLQTGGTCGGKQNYEHEGGTLALHITGTVSYTREGARDGGGAPLPQLKQTHTHIHTWYHVMIHGSYSGVNSRGKRAFQPFPRDQTNDAGCHSTPESYDTSYIAIAKEERNSVHYKVNMCWLSQVVFEPLPTSRPSLGKNTSTSYNSSTRRNEAHERDR